MSQAPEAFCRAALPEVSRTFALNIPVLPAPLDFVVTVAYLLCRIADTLEDEAEPGPLLADRFAELAHLVKLPEGWPEASKRFAEQSEGLLRPGVPAAELHLLRGTPQVLEALASLPEWTRPHIEKCVATMAEGMNEVVQQLGTAEEPSGLRDLDATLAYCYYVAGTVGEMLTGLFIDYSPAVATRAADLLPRAQGFGRALQLTNILKDIREDLERASCWLPRSLMEAQGLTPGTLLLPKNREKAVGLLNELVAVARAEADEAFEYSLAIPVSESGLRLFCLWPLFFAVQTLATLEGNPAVFDEAPVKIGREAVQRIMAMTKERVASDAELRRLYAECKRKLPFEHSRAL